MSTFNLWGDSLKSTLHELFSQVEPDSRPAKSLRGAGAKGGSSSQGAPAEKQPVADSEWLKTTLERTFEVFGAAVENRFKAVEQRVDNVETKTAQIDTLAIELQKMEERIAKLETTKASADVSMNDAIAQASQETDRKLQQTQSALEEMKAMQERVDMEVREVRRMSATSGSNSLCRTTARMGNLGWDTLEETLLDRAKDALRKAKIDPSTWNHLSASCGRSGRGSGCELIFKSEQALLTAKAAMKSAAVAFEGDRKVWIDVKKTREELKPSRVCHRAYDVIGDVARRSGTPHETYVKNLVQKTITRGGRILCYVTKGELKFTTDGAQEWNDNDRSLISGFANDE